MERGLIGGTGVCMCMGSQGSDWILIQFSTGTAHDASSAISERFLLLELWSNMTVPGGTILPHQTGDCSLRVHHRNKITRQRMGDPP